jgi:type II secretory pathway component GspD/PulD (secretin)
MKTSRYILAGVLILVLANFGLAQDVAQKLITIHAEDAHLPTVLSILADESGYNIVTSPEVNSQDRISVHMDNVPIEQAVNLVVRAAGLSYELVGKSFLVATADRLSEEIGAKAYVIPLQYADAMEVKMILQDITEKVEVDQGGNKLLVHTSPKNISEILEIIASVDVPVLQIMLEARIIEVTLSGDNRIGIDWSRLAQITTIIAENAAPTLAQIGGSLVPGMSQQTQSDGSVIEQYSALPNGRTPDNMYFQRIDPSNTVGFSRQLSAFDVTLDMLLKNKEAEILANPSVVTLNGREAFIEMVDVIPYILSSGGVGGQVQVQREIVGIRLTVKPNVNSDGFITATITPEISNFYDFVGPERNIPWVQRRRSTTTVRVGDGEPIIIAGLLAVDRKKIVHTVPILGKVPYIGRFFKHEFEQETKKDFIIEITPHIVRDTYTSIDKSERMVELENTYINVEEVEEDETEYIDEVPVEKE